MSLFYRKNRLLFPKVKKRLLYRKNHKNLLRLLTDWRKFEKMVASSVSTDEKLQQTSKSNKSTCEGDLIVINDSDSSSDENEDVQVLTLKNAIYNKVVNCFENPLHRNAQPLSTKSELEILPMQIKVDDQNFKLMDTGNVELFSVEPCPLEKLRFKVEPSNLEPNEQFYHRCIEHKQVGRLRYYLLQKNGQRFIRIDMPEENWKIFNSFQYTLLEVAGCERPTTQHLLNMMYTLSLFMLLNLYRMDKYLYFPDSIKICKQYGSILNLGQKLWTINQAKHPIHKKCPIFKSCVHLPVSRKNCNDDIFYHCLKHLNVGLKCNVKDKSGKFEKYNYETLDVDQFTYHLYKQHPNSVGNFNQKIKSSSDFYNLQAKMDKLVEQHKNDIAEERKVENCLKVDEAAISRHFVTCHC